MLEEYLLPSRDYGVLHFVQREFAFARRALDLDRLVCYGVGHTDDAVGLSGPLQVQRNSTIQLSRAIRGWKLATAAKGYPETTRQKHVL